MTEFGFETTGAEVVVTFKDEVKAKTSKAGREYQICQMLTQHRVFITGAGANGLGAGMAVALARGNPSHLLLQARSLPRIQPVLDEIRFIAPDIKITFIPFDLSDPASVRAASSEVLGSIDKLDVLINNAGVMAVQDYTLNKDGNELTIATNHFGPFLLTKMLMPKIIAAGPAARIVNVSSLGHRISPFRFDDWNFSVRKISPPFPSSNAEHDTPQQDGKTYNLWTAYGQSKTANVLFTRGLASNGVLSFSCHPGSRSPYHFSLSTWPH